MCPEFKFEVEVSTHCWTKLFGSQGRQVRRTNIYSQQAGNSILTTLPLIYCHPLLSPFSISIYLALLPPFFPSLSSPLQGWIINQKTWLRSPGRRGKVFIFQKCSQAFACRVFAPKVHMHLYYMYVNYGEGSTTKLFPHSLTSYDIRHT